MPLAPILGLLAALFASPQDPEPCHIHGTLVDEAGQPVAGATVKVNGWTANNDREREFGRPKNWTNPAALVTEDDGRFAFEFVPPQAFQFVVDVEAPGKGKVGWRWSRVKYGEELDLGRTVLEPEAILVGYILDEDGTLLAEGWRVSAWHSWGRGIGGRASRGANSPVDPETGRFRIEGLPPGELRVTASRGSTHIPEATVTTKVGEDTELVLRYEGPDVSRRLVVTVFSRPFYPFDPAQGSVHAVGHDGVRHPLVPAPGRASDWHVLDLEPGAYRVEFTDPRFDELVIEELRTGETGRAMLKGSAALRVAVVEGATGEPVTDYVLDVGFTNVNFHPNEFRVREAGAPLPQGGLYEGIVPAEVELIVQVDGWPDARVDVPDLQPGETRDVEVRLSRGLTLEGRVVDPRGAPLPGIQVELTRGRFPGHDDPDSGPSMTFGSVDGVQQKIEIGYRDAAVTTNADGTFRFEGLASDDYSVLAVRGPMVEVHKVVTLPSESPSELTLPDVVEVRGTVLLPPGVSPDMITVEGVLAGESRPPSLADSVWRMARNARGRSDWRPDDEGRLAPRQYPAGEYELRISRSVARDVDGDVFTMRERIDARTLTLESDTELELDLREVYPVPITLRVELPRDDMELDGLNLRARFLPVGEDEAPQAMSQSRVEGRHLVLETSGPPRELAVELRGLGFSWRCDRTIHPERGGPNEFDVSLPLVHRTLVLRSAGEEALAGRRVALWGADGTRYLRTANEEGEITVLRPAGPLSVATVPPPDEEDESVKRARQFGFDPPVDPEVLESLEAAATIELAAGEGPIVVELPVD